MLSRAEHSKLRTVKRIQRSGADPVPYIKVAGALADVGAHRIMRSSLDVDVE